MSSLATINGRRPNDDGWAELNIQQLKESVPQHTPSGCLTEVMVLVAVGLIGFVLGICVTGAWLWWL